jgi:hypothetical protein
MPRFALTSRAFKLKLGVLMPSEAVEGARDIQDGHGKQ